MESIGGKYKGAASATQFVSILKNTVLAKSYDQNDIKTRGDITPIDIRQFLADATIYSEIVRYIPIPAQPIRTELNVTPGQILDFDIMPTNTLYININATIVYGFASISIFFDTNYVNPPNFVTVILGSVSLRKAPSTFDGKSEYYFNLNAFDGKPPPQLVLTFDRPVSGSGYVETS